MGNPSFLKKIKNKLHLHQRSQFVEHLLQPTTYPNVPTKRSEHVEEVLDSSHQVSALQTEVSHIWHYLYKDTHPPHD